MTRKSIAYYVQKEIDEYYLESCIHCGDEDCLGGSSTVESCMRLNWGPHGFIDLAKYKEQPEDGDGPQSCMYLVWVPDDAALEALKALKKPYCMDMEMHFVE